MPGAHAGELARATAKLADGPVWKRTMERSDARRHAFVGRPKRGRRTAAAASETGKAAAGPAFSWAAPSASQRHPGRPDGTETRRLPRFTAVATACKLVSAMTTS